MTLLFRWLLTWLLFVSGHTAHQTPQEHTFHQINHIRAEHHRHPLSVQPALQARAQLWANHMAKTHRLDDDMQGGSAVCWKIPGSRVYGANAGYGPSQSAIERAFVKSPPHLANMIDRQYRWVGVGVVRANGVTWIAEDFCG